MGGTISFNQQSMLLCGLEGSGKSLFLKKLMELNKKNQDLIPISTTFGYNYICFEYTNQKYHIWDLGGDSISRQFWPSFYRNIQVNIILYFINIYETEEKQIASIKEFLYLVNEEELKMTKFFIIFNLKLENSNKNTFSDCDLKEANQKVDYIFSIIHDSQVHDIDNRVSHFIVDISKIKQGELSTTRLLNNCFMIPEEDIS